MYEKTNRRRRVTGSQAVYVLAKAVKNVHGAASTLIVFFDPENHTSSAAVRLGGIIKLSC